MTPKFDSNQVGLSRTETKDVEKQVISTLEQANSGLSDDVLSDIAQARLNALRKAQETSPKPFLTQHIQGMYEWLRYDLFVHNYKMAAPLAVAVVVTVLVSYTKDNSVPVLPVEFLSDDVLTEELAMLEDLEFANWLAEQQQEGLL